jgi:hypothetical protein
LPVIASSDYGDLIVANNKLFIAKRDYSNSSNYIHSLLEIDQTNGNVINTFNLSTDFSNASNNPDNSPESLVFNQETNEIIGIVGNIVVKFNITSNTDTSFILPVIASSDYGDLIVANNKLFIAKRDYSNSSNYIHSLLEINQTNGNVINTFNLSTDFSNASNNPDNSPESLVFNQETNEIIGIVGNIVVKFNITSNTDTSFILPVIASSDYGDLIVTFENSLGINDSILGQSEKLKLKKAYNMLGQEVSLDTKNEIIILEYENGFRKKVINLN